MATRREVKQGKQEKGSSDVAEKVVVAVKASKEIPKTALVWALTHVVQPGDCITLLLVVPSHGSGRRFWAFPRFSGHQKSHSGTNSEQRQLKHEEKRCMELQCNIVVMKHSQAKVLRLNLVGTSKRDGEVACSLTSDPDESSEKDPKNKDGSLDSIRGLVVTPTSSSEIGTPFTATEAGTSSVSSSDPGTSPFFIPEIIGDLKKESSVIREDRILEDSSSDTDSENLSLSSASMRFQPWTIEFLRSHHKSSRHMEEECFRRTNNKTQSSTTKALLEKFSRLDRDAGVGMSSYRTDMEFSGNIREAVSLSRHVPSGPPPLCSICQHKAPVFGKPPRWFRYAELELAIGGFSQANFLAEGGFGSVHRGYSAMTHGHGLKTYQRRKWRCPTVTAQQMDTATIQQAEAIATIQQAEEMTPVPMGIEGSGDHEALESIHNKKGRLESMRGIRINQKK